MNWHVRVRPEAELDLLVAAGWYDAQSPGLGTEFIAEMAAVAYQIRNDEVVVLSVLHMRRQRRI